MAARSARKSGEFSRGACTRFRTFTGCSISSQDLDGSRTEGRLSAGDCRGVLCFLCSHSQGLPFLRGQSP
ncbi:hypothetical protein H5410_035987 [Solanum commersonii]|uniref:Uncharacterized protein n=1 Tax=Solanum commersonii TaxID=4109 RepID=A0A9J5Y297_SOLCO|nr:hypothetical protein H5410_035987 [Solanum commersonii]